MVLNFVARSHFTLIACFITFYVLRALQQKQQHQCIIYCMHCRFLLSENSGQISIRDSNTKCLQFEFENRCSKIRTSFNIPVKKDIVRWSKLVEGEDDCVEFCTMMVVDGSKLQHDVGEKIWKALAYQSTSKTQPYVLIITVTWLCKRS